MQSMGAGRTDFHLEESAIAAFCRRWAQDPESVNADEFDAIQIHLLKCEACWSIAKRYEDIYAGASAAVVAFDLHIGPDEVERLRRDCERLCADLTEGARAWDEGRLAFSDLQPLFENAWKPKALQIAQALLQYVPGEAPEILGVQWEGNIREIEWRDADALQSPLSPESAGRQLHRLSRILRNLLEYLP